MKAVIIGGTGTLGHAMARQLLSIEKEYSLGDEIIVVSRCELKQKQMCAQLENHPNLSFALGDIRDRDKMHKITRGATVVFHFAALKHVEVMEENPDECIKTNILGTLNVADACEANSVPHMVFSSTDKAVDPINVYGFSKAISEKILFNRNKGESPTHFSVFRWGNVLGSRGSVIHEFQKTLKAEQKAYLTHEDMTRFWIRIEDAVKYMLYHYRSAPLDKACIPPIKAATVQNIIRAIAEVSGISTYSLVQTGIRKGEKIHESLLSVHSDNPQSSDKWEQYSTEELISLMRTIL